MTYDLGPVPTLLGCVTLTTPLSPCFFTYKTPHAAAFLGAIPATGGAQETAPATSFFL